MGSKKSGNRLPKEKASPDEKSVNFGIRLNPRNDDHRWALGEVRRFLSEQRALPLEQRRSLGDLFVEALQAKQGIERVEPTVLVSAWDVADIKSIVQYLMDKIESGEFAPATNTRKKRAPKNDLSESMRETVDRYLSRGFAGSDDLDEDE